MSERKDVILKFAIPIALLLVLVIALILGNRWLQSNQQLLPIVVFLASPLLGWMTWVEFRKGEASLGAMGGNFKRSENPSGFWSVFAFNVLMTMFLFAYPLLTDFHW